jgi:outer membrane protein assembly factor BamB
MKYLYLGISSFFFLSFLKVNGEWHQFRGVSGQGHVDTKIPKFWSQDSPNLAWRTAIIGTAWSSPILVRDQIVVTNARTLSNGKSLDLEVVALNESTGKISWTSSLFTYPDLPRIHRKNSYASPTPYFDGESIFVHYGNLGTACLNTDGKTRWKKVFDYSPVHGSGCSPVVHDNLLIFSADGASDPCIYGLDKKNGNLSWKTTRTSNTKKNFFFVYH